MALSGIFYGTTSNPRLKPQIVWSAVQSPEGNYSDVTASLQYTRSNSGYTTGGTWTGTLTIGEETVQDTLYMEITYGNVTTVLTHTARIYHDDNGEKSITISATGGITYPAEASLKTTTISQSVTLDTILTASAISASDGNIGSCATVVVNKKASAFTHSLAYEFGSLSGYINASGQPVEEEEIFPETVVNFFLPESFYGEIPDSKTGICTVICRTYSGDRVIGEKTTQFTVTASEVLCAPEVTLTVTDCNEATISLTGDSAVLVRKASDALCVLSAQGKNGATILQKQIAGQPVEDFLVLSGVDSPTISAFVTDSRGYKTEITSTPKTVPYVALTGNASVKRLDPTGDKALLTLEGQCFRGSFGQAENSLTVTVTVPALSQSFTLSPELREDNSYYLTLELSGLDYTRSYSVTVTAQDRLSRVDKTLTVHRGVPVFDWGEGDFAFHVPVSVPELLINGKTLAQWLKEV